MMLFLNIIDWFLFIVFGVCVLYLLFFSVCSLFKVKDKIKSDSKNSAEDARILVIFPVYKEDSIIRASLASFIKQDYDKAKYDVYVVADHFQADAISRLKEFPVNVLDVCFKDSSKAKALNYVISSLGSTEYDIVTILDVDNEVDNNYLSKLNEAYLSGYHFIQAHRVAKNLSSHTAYLDAVSEEINNSIFRKGHTNIGLSAALIGSGLAFDYQWFKEHVSNLSTVGEDKELEAMLHKDRIYVHYLQDVLVYDQKTAAAGAFHKQRLRWQSAQRQMFLKCFRESFTIYKDVGLDYWDKLFQWLMPPRSVVLIVTGFLSVLTIFISLEWAYKWWLLFIILIIALSLAVPRKMYTKQIFFATLFVPYLSFLMMLNFASLKKGSKKFIHTKH